MCKCQGSFGRMTMWDFMHDACKFSMAFIPKSEWFAVFNHTTAWSLSWAWQFREALFIPLIAKKNTGPLDQMYQYDHTRPKKNWVQQILAAGFQISMNNISIPQVLVSLKLAVVISPVTSQTLHQLSNWKNHQKNNLQSKLKQLALEVPPEQSSSWKLRPVVLEPKRNPETWSPNPPHDQRGWLVRDLPQVPMIIVVKCHDSSCWL